MDRQQFIDLLVEYHAGAFIPTKEISSLIKGWYKDKELEIPDDKHCHYLSILIKYGDLDQLFSALLGYYEQKHNIIKVLEETSNGTFGVIHIY